MRKLDKAYKEIDSRYKNNPEGIKEELESVKTELASKKELLGKLTKTAPEELVDKTKNEISYLEKRANNLEGYSKYGKQIELIQKFKDKLVNKLKEQEQLKQDITKSIKEAKENAKEANEKLSDEEYLKTLTNEEYNKLLIAKENEKSIEKQEKELADIEKNIINLKGKIGKCDLAWRTLFNNKDWDEIQLRVQNNKKMTRKITEETTPIKLEVNENEEKGKMSQIISNMGEAADKVLNTIGIETIEEEVPETDLPAKITRWDKVKSFFRNIKNKFLGVKETDTDRETDKEINNNTIDNKEKDNSERDEFIEGLRKYADKEYRQEVKRELDEKSKQAHEVKQNDNER